mmetsp:Transcript_12088/g.18550  ORF Transcript_12088/g.18550 Transcript_12088/m.18550 type:complete len:172 (-) Transcript_12088:154-669(-)
MTIMLQQRFLLVACLVASVSSCAICGEGGTITKSDAIFDLPPESQGKYPSPYENDVPCGIMEIAAKSNLINEIECTQLTTLTNVYDICGCEGGVRATLEPTPAPTTKSPVTSTPITTTEGDVASPPTDKTLTVPVPPPTPQGDALTAPTSSSSVNKYFISVLGMLIGVLVL